jgi:hypothetical protein
MTGTAPQLHARRVGLDRHSRDFQRNRATSVALCGHRGQCQSCKCELHDYRAPLSTDTRLCAVRGIP